jgi:hypothetical protein
LSGKGVWAPSRLLKNAEIPASSFDRLRMRWSDFNGLDLMVSLSRFDGLTVRPWAVFSSLLEPVEIFVTRLSPCVPSSRKAHKRLSGVLRN